MNFGSATTGAAGVVSAGFGFDKAIEKLGIDRRVYTAGTSKAILDPFKPEKPEDIARLRELQKDIHDTFIGLVKLGYDVSTRDFRVAINTLLIFLVAFQVFVIGMLAVRVLSPLARAIQPWVARLSNVALYVVLAATLIGYSPRLGAIVGTGALVAALVFILVAFGMGYVAGWGETISRTSAR